MGLAKTVAAIGSAALMFLATTVMAQESQGDQAVTCDNEMQRELALLAAPIKSPADLKRYMKADLGDSSPLNRLPERARRVFVKSIKFNEKGVVGFNYFELEANLSYSEIYRVLSLFGIQHLITVFDNAKIETDLDRKLADRVSAGTVCL